MYLELKIREKGGERGGIENIPKCRISNLKIYLIKRRFLSVLPRIGQFVCVDT